MMLWKRTAAALLLYLVTTCSAEISAAQPRSQTIIRPAPGSAAAGARTLANNAASASANASSGGGEYAWSQWGAWSPCSRTCGGGVAVQERQCLPSDTNRWLRGRKRRRLPPGPGPSHRIIKEPGPTSHVENRPDPNRTHEHEATLRKDVTLQRRLAEERRRKEEWRSEDRSSQRRTDENRRLYERSQENSKRTTEDKGRTEEKERTEMLNERRSAEGRGNEVQRGERLEGRRRVHRRAREIRNADLGCRGMAKRYHECNTAPCQGPAREPRAEQCASYDRRPFKGRFYTWVPYVDAESPCTLNCRPRGQQFYASLGLVADGTPCTRPGFRAICVQGSCKVVGREGVLSASSSRDLRCGRRLVSGLFSRPRLPLGYSHIATVPPGACRLNISELQPSENYIALKLTNGSFIMNGEFAVSSPGTYEAAGAQFIYRRAAGVETIYTHGPTMQSLDIMILYQHPNPSIKYEYLTETLPDEAVGGDNPPEVVPAGATHHLHRHHGTEPHTKSLSTPTQSDLPKDNTAGVRRFNWRILSFTPCSRTCGGGIQMGKFRCVEEGNSREVSPVHCSGALPAARRRRCNMIACPPRWRTTAWSNCPPCGPASQTRNVGCVQDHSRGLTKISDSKCSQPMPTGTQLCDIPSCDSNAIPSEPRGQDTRRQVHERDHTERFHAAPARPPLSRPYNRTDRYDTDNDISAVLGPEYFSAAGGWLYTEWSECVGWCVGGGVRSRGVRCADPAGCAAARAPLPSQSCTPRAACEPHTTHWFTGDWSACSAECGGRQVRAVVCLGGAGRRARDAACSEPRPQAERACGSNCQPTWFLSDWSQCTGACGAGVQSRTVWCARGDVSSAAAREAECLSPRPPARRACDPPRCEPGAPAAPAPPPAALPDVPRAAHPPPPPPPPQQYTTPDPQRIPRNQNQNPRTSPLDEHHNNPGVTGGGGCTDRLTSCALAVQARLCHYHYYSLYCCRSCNSSYSKP